MDQEQLDQETEVRALQEELSKLTLLLGHPGFVYLLVIAKAQMEARANNLLLRPLDSMDEALGQEFLKGEYSGIKLFSEIAGLRIDDLKQQIDERLKENETEPLDYVPAGGGERPWSAD